MESFLFGQLRKIREVTLNEVIEVSENEAVVIPAGFNNSILWNLGHIYLIQERLAFHSNLELAQIPEGFHELFMRGTKPSDWILSPPALSSLTKWLEDQPERIHEVLKDRLEEIAETPFTTSSGVTLKVISEFLTYSLYHEGMHVQTIRMIKRFSK